MSALDDIRAEIVARRDQALRMIELAKAGLADADLELLAHDRAVALFDAPPKPERAKRRDIAELVLAALTDEWQTIAQLAKATGCAPSRVEPALKRIKHDGMMDGKTLMLRRGDRQAPL
jgi:hypothetical protein